jgi:hypothetical protein
MNHALLLLFSEILKWFQDEVGSAGTEVWGFPGVEFDLVPQPEGSKKSAWWIIQHGCDLRGTGGQTAHFCTGPSEHISCFGCFLRLSATQWAFGQKTRCGVLWGAGPSRPMYLNFPHSIFQSKAALLEKTILANSWQVLLWRDSHNSWHPWCTYNVPDPKGLCSWNTSDRICLGAYLLAHYCWYALMRDGLQFGSPLPWNHLQCWFHSDSC